MDNVPLISQVMLYNQQDPFTVALIVPERARLREALGIRDGAPVRDKELDVIIEEIRLSLLRYRRDPALTSTFVTAWTPKTFALLPEGFTEENGTMNASLKLVRRHIVERFRERIRRLYDDEEDPVNASNREALRCWLREEKA